MPKRFFIRASERPCDGGWYEDPDPEGDHMRADEADREVEELVRWVIREIADNNAEFYGYVEDEAMRRWRSGATTTIEAKLKELREGDDDA